MNLSSLLENEEINEELVLFKKSKKLSGYADKIEGKLTKFIKTKNIEPDKAKLLQNFVDKIRNASLEFETIEKDYKNKKLSHKEAKSKIADLKKKYSSLMKDLKKENLGKAFKVLGLTAILAAIAGTIALFGVSTTITGGPVGPGFHTF